MERRIRPHPSDKPWFGHRGEQPESFGFPEFDHSHVVLNGYVVFGIHGTLSKWGVGKVVSLPTNYLEAPDAKLRVRLYTPAPRYVV